MKTAKYLAAIYGVICLFNLPLANASAALAPIVGDFGNVAPRMDTFLDAYRTHDPAPWFVTFNLVTPADTIVGAKSLGESSFHVDHVALYDDIGELVAPKYCVVIVDGCPDELRLPLSAGHYALGVFGDGNRTIAPPGADPFDSHWDQPDFRAYIQLMPIPEPETYTLMLAGLGLVGFMARRLDSNKF